VKQRARSLGIDLASLQGSGPDGRVEHADLDATLSSGLHSGVITDGTREVKLIGLRRAIARKMQESKRHIPHYTYVEEVDVTELVALRDQLNAQHGATRGELSPLAFVIRAVVRAVAAYPQVNARFDDEAEVLTLFDAVHLGVATQTDTGLMVPVLRQAQTLDLWACAAAIARLAATTRAGKATRDELTGSTLTVTSLGKLGGIASTPVINHPEVAIVGINRIVARPMVVDGAVQVRQMMNLSSSFDHRVVDGAVAAAYIQQVRRLLEHPALLFIE
jgi:2-oxoisovalerate dehydrogenase E2 component (dihydrolipoyl transacylase)